MGLLTKKIHSKVAEGELRPSLQREEGTDVCCWFSILYHASVCFGHKDPGCVKVSVFPLKTHTKTICSVFHGETHSKGGSPGMFILSSTSSQTIKMQVEN